MGFLLCLWSTLPWPPRLCQVSGANPEAVIAFPHCSVLGPITGYIGNPKKVRVLVIADSLIEGKVDAAGVEAVLDPAIFGIALSQGHCLMASTASAFCLLAIPMLAVWIPAVVPLTVPPS